MRWGDSRPGAGVSHGGRVRGAVAALARVARGTLRLVLRAALAVLLLWAGLIVLYRWIDPPATPLMIVRLFEHGRWWRTAVPLDRVSPHLVRAVLAAEDARFCQHHGIDVEAVGDAMGEWRRGQGLRGASTISMQTARNLFLWQGGGFVRKALEAPLALALDAAWPKRRTLEIYLGIAEWGEGVYGAEAAARRHFGVSSAALSPRQAAALAAILPSPRKWKANPPGDYVAQRIPTLLARMEDMGAYMGCLKRG